MSWPCLGLRLALLALGIAGGPEEKKAVPVYTNDDLDRMAPLRDQTGVSSTVAAPPPSAPGRAADDGQAKSEAYWRKEADRVRTQLQRTRDRIEDLRSRIAASEAPSHPRSEEARTRGAARVEAWRRQVAMLEAHIRESEGTFADRARKAGALPGWVR
jgi:hypothetical protein